MRACEMKHASKRFYVQVAETARRINVLRLKEKVDKLFFNSSADLSSLILILLSLYFMAITPVNHLQFKKKLKCSSEKNKNCYKTKSDPRLNCLWQTYYF